MRELFRAYAAWLAIAAAFPDLEAELAALPAGYAPPAGELLLALDDAGAVVGCVGVRPLEPARRCELKRLYVLEGHRRSGAGRALVSAAASFARRAGYSEIVLDTLPSMIRPIALYRSFGFAPIEPYYDSPGPGALFFRKALDGYALAR